MPVSVAWPSLRKAWFSRSSITPCADPTDWLTPECGASPLTAVPVLITMTPLELLSLPGELAMRLCNVNILSELSLFFRLIDAMVAGNTSPVPFLHHAAFRTASSRRSSGAFTPDSA